PESVRRLPIPRSGNIFSGREARGGLSRRRHRPTAATTRLVSIKHAKPLIPRQGGSATGFMTLATTGCAAVGDSADGAEFALWSIRRVARPRSAAVAGHPLVAARQGWGEGIECGAGTEQGEGDRAKGGGGG